MINYLFIKPVTIYFSIFIRSKSRCINSFLTLTIGIHNFDPNLVESAQVPY
jgi:hypothetical protein